MRLLRITYRCFGPFDEKSFDLSGGREGVHLFYGPNEAGKSTALRGVKYLLFGFPSRRCEDFRYPAPKQQLEAHLQSRSGQELLFRRVRGRNALQRLDGKSLAPEMLQQFLGGLTEDRFQMLFGLDHRLLVEGGRQIVEGRGALGEALFAAGAGMAGLRRLRSALSAKAQELYAPRATTRTKINPLLLAIQDKRKQEQEALLRFETWKRVVDEHQDAVAEQQRWEAHRQEVRREISRLETYQGLLPSIRQFQEKMQEFQKLPDRDPILDEQNAIRELREKLGACQKANNDRDELAAESERLKSQALGILKTAFGRESLEAAAELCPSKTVRSRIRELAEQYQACREAEEKAQKQLRELTSKMENSQRRLAELPPLTDAGELQTCYEAVLQEGPLEKNLQAVEAELAEVETKADQYLTRLRICWEGTLEEAASLRPPPEERIAEYREKFDAFQQQRRQIEEKIHEWENILRVTERSIQQLKEAGEILTDESLRQARQERNKGLEWVRIAWLQPDRWAPTLADSFIQKYAPGEGLWEALKNSIEQCDQLADRLHSEAQRVAQWESHQQRLTEALQGRQTLQQRLAELQTQQAALQQEWEAEWAPWDIRPKSPAEMAGWRQSYSELLNKLPTIRRLQTQQRQLQEQIAACRRRLQTALGLESLDPKQSLQELLALAKKQMDEVKAQANERRRLETELEHLRSQRQEAEQHSAETSHRLQQWTADWQEAIRSLDAAPDALPKKVQQQLDQLDEIRSLLEKAEGFEERIAGIDRDTEEFLYRLNQVRSRLSPGCPPSTLQTMQADLDGLDARLNAAQGAEDRRQAIQKDLDRLRNELLAHAGGKSLDEFCDEVLQQADRFATCLEELREKQDQLDAQIAQSSEKAGRAAHQLETWQQAGDAAAQHRQDRMAMIAQLRDHLIEYAVCYVAKKVLDQAVENFRQRHEQTMFSRAGEYFRLLTCGAFEKLDIDEDGNGQSVLKAVRINPAIPDQEEWVDVEGLSDGARDQLFLALRLAGIEEHCQRGEPMPVIIDDALINFDDQRAAAALEALAELSRKTQILLFTHHEHLAALARRHLSGEVLFCYAF